jgi:hypothetical protein
MNFWEILFGLVLIYVAGLVIKLSMDRTYLSSRREEPASPIRPAGLPKQRIRRIARQTQRLLLMDAMHRAMWEHRRPSSGESDPR